MSEDPKPEIENEGEVAESNNEDAKEQTESSAVDSAKQNEEQKRSGVQQRIGQLTKEKYDAIRKAEELEARLNSIEDSKPKETLIVPKSEDFEDYSEYEKTHAEYLVKVTANEVAKQNQAEIERQKTAERHEQRHAVAQKFVDRVEAEKNQFEDFDLKFSDPTFGAITQKMDSDLIELIQSSENGTALTYHLATHLDDADRIASLSPIRAARELTLIEAGLEKPKSKPVSDAPDPIQPIGSSETAVKDPNKMTTNEWMKWRSKNLDR